MGLDCSTAELFELLHEGVDIVKGLVIQERHSRLYLRQLFMECWSVVFIYYTKRELFLVDFHRFRECGVKIARLVILRQLISALQIILIRIYLIEGYAGLQDIDQ